MKKLMYISISILSLSIAALIGFHIGSQVVHATIVAEPVGNIVALAGDCAITTSGEMYWWHDGNYWVGPEQLPFPVEQLRFATKGSGGLTFIDADGNYWDATRGNVGPPPGGNVTTDQSSLGNVKGMYKED